MGEVASLFAQVKNPRSTCHMVTLPGSLAVGSCLPRPSLSVRKSVVEPSVVALFFH